LISFSSNLSIRVQWKRIMKLRRLAVKTLILSVLLFGPSIVFASNDPIVLAGDENFHPIEYLDDDTPKGLNVELINELAKAMGRKIEIRLMQWQEAQQKVLNGEIDGLTTMSITEKRKELYDFSEVTLQYQYSIFVKAEQIGIQTAQDLEGKAIGVTKGGLPHQVLESNPRIKLVLIENNLDGFRRLLTQAVDPVIWTA
jgi:ABC-type amino acid transport substrate-binding protein